jgi:succinylglutamate desuccinylase
VTLLLGNPEAAAADVRFLEEDLNRVFTFDRPADSLERRRAEEIRPLLDAADLFLDFHQTQTPTESAFWTFPWDPELAAWARVAGAAPRGLTRAPGGIFSAGKCCLDEYVRGREKIGFTAEVGEKGADSNQARLTYEAARRVLLAVDVVMSGEGTLGQIAESQAAIEWYRTVGVGAGSSPDVRLRPGLVNWSAVSEGEILSPPEGPLVRAASDGCILFPKYPGLGEPAPPELYRLAQMLPDPWSYYS